MSEGGTKRCELCGRATLTPHTYLPLTICDRAGCKPERDHLTRQWVESKADFDWLYSASIAPHSGVNRA